MLIIAFLLTVLVLATGAFADYQLALWTDGYYRYLLFLIPVKCILFYLYSAEKCLILYSALLGAVIILHVLRNILYIQSGLQGSRNHHKSLLNSMLAAPFSFFDKVPSGRITSRFSMDMATVDFDIPISVCATIESILGIITGVGMVIIQSPIYTILLIPLVLKYLQTRDLYRKPSKALKAMDSATKSPLFSHNKECLDGLECIRAYRIQQFMIRKHHELLDLSICTRLNWDGVNRWLGIRLDMLGALIVSFAAFSIAFSGSSSAGVAGLLLNYAIRATQSLSFAVRCSTALENQFNAPERIIEYINIEPELANSHEDYNDLEDDIELPSVSKGGEYLMQVIKLNAKYGENLPLVLKNLTFNVRKGQLVGICGRTGCGKSKS